MALIDKIGTSQLLTKLAGSSSSSSSPSVGGSRTSFSFDKVDLSAGLEKLSEAFSESSSRLRAPSAVLQGGDVILEKLLKLADKMLAAAKRASSAGVSSSDRITLNSKFQKAAIEFKRLLASSKVSGIDFRDKSQIETILKNSGIDTGAATTLANLFNQLAPISGKLGYAKFRIEDVFVQDDVTTTSTQSSGSFQARVTYQTQTNPTRINLGDFNNDGISDVLATGGAGNTIGILTGNSDGSYHANVSIDVGGTQTVAVVGNFNGDSNQDIATTVATVGVAGGGLTDVGHYVGANSDGTFRYGTSFPLAAAPNIATGDSELYDLNNDGNLDLVVASAQQFYVSIGNGDGTFAAAQTYASGGSYGFTLGDFDGDGHADLIAARNPNSTGIAFLRGNADGSFDAPISITLPDNQAYDVKSAYLDNDSSLDLIVKAQNATLILKGNGDGTFFAGVTLESAGRAVATGDFNNDGETDLVLNGGSGGVTYIRIGNGDGTFSQGFSDLGAIADTVATGDFNNDGNNDIAIGYFDGSVVYAFLGNGDGTFNARVSYSGNGLGALTIQDLNGDGYDDLVAGSSTTSLGIYLANSDGTLKARQNFALASTASGASVGDVDGDGLLDVVGISNAGESAQVILANSDAGASGQWNSSQLYLTDLVGSSNPELVQQTADNKTLNIYATDIDGTLTGLASVTVASGGSSAVSTYSTQASPRDIALGDLDGNGSQDLIVSHTSSSVIDILQGSNGTLSSATTVNIGITPTAIAVGEFVDTVGTLDATFVKRFNTVANDDIADGVAQDFNNDGILDLMLCTYSAGNSYRLFYHQGNGDGTFLAGQTVMPSSSEYTGAQYRDVNFDGKLDILHNSGFDSIAVGFGNGDGTFNAVTSYFFGIGFPYFRVVDVDGDNIFDVVGSHYSGFTDFVMLGNSNGTFKASRSMDFGINIQYQDSAINFADINGDNKIDIIRRNQLAVGNGDGTFDYAISIPSAVYFSGNNVGPAKVADINGDSKLDLVYITGDPSVVSRVYSQLGNGDGTFLAPVSFANVVTSNSDTYSIELTDMNNDGELDMVTHYVTAAKNAVFYGNGDGSFTAGKSFTTNIVSSILPIVADFNGDGLKDIANLTDSPIQSQFEIYLQQPPVDLSQADDLAVAVASPTAPGLVERYHTGEFSVPSDENLFSYNLGDGTSGALSYTAVLTTHLTMSAPVSSLGFGLGNMVFVDDGAGGYYGVGKNGNDLTLAAEDVYGNFTLSQSYDLGGGQTNGRINSGDLNGDGKTDYYTNVGSQISVLLSNTDGSLLAPTLYQGTGGSNSVDFMSGAYAMSVDGTGSVWVAANNGDGSFAAPVSYSAAGATFTGIYGGGIGTFYAIDSTSGSLFRFDGNGDGTWLAPTSTAAPGYLTSSGSLSLKYVSPVGLVSEGYGAFGPFGAPHIVSWASTPVGLGGDSIVEATGTNLGGGAGYTISASSYDVFYDYDYNVVGYPPFYTSNIIGTYSDALTGGPAVRDPYGHVIVSKVDGVYTQDPQANTALDVTKQGYDINSQILAGGASTFSIGYELTYLDDYAFQAVHADFNSDGTGDTVFYAGSDLNYMDGLGGGPTSSGDLSTPDYLLNLKTGDFNDDGNLDLVASDTLGNNFYVALGNGDGSFNEFKSYAFYSGGATTNAAFAVYDRNNDGRDDIIAGIGGSNVQVFTANADGSFSAVTSIVGAGIDAEEIVVDTNSGLIVAHNTTTFTTISSFGLTQTFSSGTNYSKTLLGDITGDGKVDIIAYNTSDPWVAVFQSNSNGTFKAAKTYALTGYGVVTGQNSLIVEDFDNDGVVEIATRLADGNLHHLENPALFENTFQDIKATTTATSHTFIDTQIAYLDSSSAAPEMVYMGLVGGTLSLAVGQIDENGNYAENVSALPLFNPESLAVGYFGGGNNDVVINDADGFVHILTGNGDGTFSAMATLFSGSLSDIHVWDLDSSGSYDLVGLQDLGGGDYGLLSVATGNGNGTFNAIATFEIDNSTFVINSLAMGSFIFGGTGGDVATFGNGQVFVSAANSDGSFSYAVSVDTGLGNTVNKVIGTDLNGTAMDLVLQRSSGSAAYSVMLNNGDGTFSAAVSVNASNGALMTNTTVIDVNGDSIYDIVGTDGTTTYVFAGNSNGSFSVGRSFEVGTLVTAGALDSEGKRRIITYSSTGGTFHTVAYGANTSQFKDSNVTVQGASDRQQVYAGELTGDYQPELVTLSTTAGRIYTNSVASDGATSALYTHNDVNAVTFTTAALADLDGDDKLDIVASNGTDFYFLKGNGDGTFDNSVSYVGYGNNVQLTDIDGDGNLDVVGNISGNDAIFGVSLGNGNGTFKAAKTSDLYTTSSIGRVGFGDFNEDGKTDIIAALSSGKISVSYGNADGTFLAAVSSTLAGTNASTIINVTDRAGSAHASALVGGTFGVSTSGFVKASGDGAGGFSVGSVFKSDGNNFLTDVRVADVNGDGYGDVVGMDSNSNVGIFLGNDDGATWQAVVTVHAFGESGNSLTGIATGDFTGDGRADILARTATKDHFITENRVTSDGSVRILTGNGNGTFAQGNSYATAASVTELTYADVNADGYNDLLTADGESGDFSVMIGNSNGSFQARRVYTAGGASNVIATGQFDNDGTVDIVTAGDSSIRVRFGNSDGTYKVSNLLQSGYGVTDVAVADLNEDGFDDIVTASAALGKVQIFRSNGDGTFKAAKSYSAGSSPVSIAAGDFDFDGIADISVSDSATGKVNVLFGNGDGTLRAARSLALNTGGGEIVASDLNGNGTSDLIAAQYGSSAVGVIEGYNLSDGVTLENAAFGDVNNDGGTDIVVTSKSQNSFYYVANTTDKVFSNSVSQNFDSIYADANPLYVDMNGDGVKDLVGEFFHPGYSGYSHRSVALGNVDGSFSNAVYSSNTFRYGGSRSELSDINNDGIKDLVFTDANNGSVYMTAGASNGTFGATTKLFDSVAITGGWAGQVKAGLIDGDGNTDLAVSAAGGILILHGNGDGTFAFGNSYFDGTPIQDLLDINGDSKLDIVAYGGSTKAIYMGNGDGTFNAVKTTPFAGAFNDPNYWGDFNGDGYQELVTVLSTSDLNVFVRRSNGDGTFQAAVSYRIADATTDVRNPLIGDFDGDGNQDIRIEDTAYNNFILYGNGNGTFEAPFSSVSLGSSVRFAVDTDGNGRTELISVLGGFTTYETSGDLTYASPHTIATNNLLKDGKLIDISGDGNLDFIAAKSDGGVGNVAEDSVYLYRGNGNGTFKSGVSYFLGTDTSEAEFVLADVNGDTRKDILRLNRDGVANPYLVTALGNSLSTFSAPVTVLAALPTSFSDLKVADIDGDNKQDLVFRQSGASVNGDGFVVYRGNGDGTYLAPKTYLSPQIGGVDASFSQYELADMNGDGYQDIVTGQSSGNQSMVVFEANSDGSFKAPTTSAYSTGGSPYYNPRIVTGDLNGDGSSEVLVTGVSPAGTNSVIHVMTNGGVGSAAGSNILILNGNGNSTFSIGASFAVSANIQDLKSVDVNNDGQTDLITADGADGKFSVYLGNSDGTFKARASYFSGSNAFAIASGRVNSGTTVDIVTADADGISVSLGNSDGTYVARTLIGPSESPTSVVVADFDGDGFDDIVSGSSTTSSVRYFRSNGDGTFLAGVSFAAGTNPVRLAASDVDGDGITDLLVSNSSTGAVSVLSFNSDAQTFSAPVSFAGGTGGGDILVSDVDGDTFSDVIVANLGGSNIAVLVGNSHDVSTTTTQTTMASQGGNTDPLHANISTRAGATLAYKALKKLKKTIDKDLKLVNGMIGELQGAQGFARAGYEAANELNTSSAGGIAEAQSIASKLAASIRAHARSTNISEHSELDTKLVAALLKDG